MPLLSRWFDRTLQKVSGVEVIPAPPAMPPKTSLPVPVKRQKMPEPRKRGAYGKSLTHPLLHFSPHDPWTLDDAFQGTAIIGETGSGKTSGSGRALAKAYLRAGFGGLVLTHKSDEVARWIGYAKETGRLQDLMVVAPGNKWTFNFLAYQFHRPGEGAGQVRNTVNGFMNVLESRYRGGRRQSQEAFWTEGAGRFLRYDIATLYAAGEPVTMQNILALLRSVPTADRQTGAPIYRPDSYCQYCLQRANNPELTAFFEQEFAAPGAERQNAGILSTLTNMADPFMSGPVRDLFCSEETTFTPEFSRLGVIIVLALPVLEWEDAGRTAQLLFKYFWQHAILRRQGLPRGERPVFLWADEAQVFVTDFDRGFQEAARSSWAATVYLTQNINNLYTAMTPDHAPAQALLGNLGTKIFHRNSDHTTNQWASDTIGKDLLLRRSGGLSGSDSESYGLTTGSQGGWSSSSGMGGANNTVSGGWNTGMNWGHSSSSSWNLGWQEQVDYLVQPSVFTRLKSGGRQNSYQVQGVVFKAGRQFRRTGHPFVDVTFPQR